MDHGRKGSTVLLKGLTTFYGKTELFFQGHERDREDAVGVHMGKAEDG